MRTIKKGTIILHVDPSMLVEGKGYRPVMVTHGEKGFHQNGNWPYTGAPGEKMPWFFGPTFADALKQVRERNALLGINEEEAAHIVTESMR